MGPSSARGTIAVVAGLLAAVVVAVGAPSPSHADGTVNVTRDDGSQPFAYEPQRVTIAPGESVTWRNPRVHTETTPPGSAEDHPTNCRQGTSKGKCPWSSEPLPVNGSFTVSFPEEGTFTYFCAVHPYMEGTIVVGDGVPDPATSPSPTPTASQQPSPPPASEEPDDEPSTEPGPDAGSEGPSEPDDGEDAATDNAQPDASDEPTDDTTSPDDAEDPTIGEGLDELGEDLGEMGEDLGEAGEAMTDGVETAMESFLRAVVRVFAVVVLLVTAALLWFVRRRSTS